MMNNSDHELTFARARLLLHNVHLVTFFVLLFTGLLILSPDLRLALLGGYSLSLLKIHSWAGAAYIAVPALILFFFGADLLVRSTERMTYVAWRKAHTAITLATGFIFTVSGLVLLAKRFVPDLLLDISRLTHDWLTYLAILFIAGHLLEVGVSAMLGYISPPAVPAGENRTATKTASRH